MKDCSIALQILSFNKSQADLLKLVDDVIALISNSGLDYNVGAFETVFEGNYRDCMDLLDKCLELGAMGGADIFANIKIHYYCNNKILTINEKLDKY